MTLATLSFICPLFMVLKKPPQVMTTLYMTTFLSVILVVTTRLGFPYSGQLGYEVYNLWVRVSVQEVKSLGAIFYVKITNHEEDKWKETIHYCTKVLFY